MWNITWAVEGRTLHSHLCAVRRAHGERGSRLPWEGSLTVRLAPSVVCTRPGYTTGPRLGRTPGLALAGDKENTGFCWLCPWEIRFCSVMAPTNSAGTVECLGVGVCRVARGCGAGLELGILSVNARRYVHLCEVYTERKLKIRVVFPACMGLSVWFGRWDMKFLRHLKCICQCEKCLLWRFIHYWNKTSP